MQRPPTEGRVHQQRLPQRWWGLWIWATPMTRSLRHHRLPDTQADRHHGKGAGGVWGGHAGVVVQCATDELRQDTRRKIQSSSSHYHLCTLLPHALDWSLEMQASPTPHTWVHREGLPRQQRHLREAVAVERTGKGPQQGGEGGSGGHCHCRGLQSVPR